MLVIVLHDEFRSGFYLYTVKTSLCPKGVFTVCFRHQSGLFTQVHTNNVHLMGQSAQR